MKRKVVIISLLLIMVFPVQVLAGQSPADFSRANQAELTVKRGDFSGFELLGPSLGDNKIYLTGIMHGVSVNADLSVKFLKYFKENAGVNYYLIESSYSRAELINKYLTTGDEEILERIYAEGGFEHEYKKWRRIYKFNQSLLPEERIKVVGIDTIGNFQNPIWYLYTLLPQEEPPEEIKPLVKELKTMHKTGAYFKASLKSWAKEVKKGIESDYDLYASYFGDGLFNFKFVTNNILNSFKVNKIFEKGKIKDTTKSFFNLRDEIMYRNFRKIYNHFPEGKYYGQFGLNHVFQKETGGVKWFGTLLNNNSISPVKGKVLSIAYLYKDCDYWAAHWTQGFELRKGLITYKCHPLDKAATSDLTLFKLTGVNSPFADSLLITLQEIPEPSPDKGTTTDYYQYAVVIKNAEAGNLLKNDK